MKKKLLIPILSLVCVLACSVCFACSGGGKDNDGNGDGHRHSAQTYFVDEDSHWKVCEDCGEEFDKGAHSLNASGICTVCGLTTVYTQGLELLELTDNGIVIAYKVAGIGSATDVDIIIPSHYNGKPVMLIGNNAFDGCSGLTSVTIPDSVTSIGYQAFYGCDKLIQTENSIQYVDKWAIGCDNSVTSVNIRSNTVGIADGAFADCSGLTSITIPDGVTSIGDAAFSKCGSLTSITIPDGVTSIGYQAFYWCSGLTSINFNGDLASWCKINGLYNLMSYGKSDRALYINGTEITGELTIPDGVTSIGSSAFSGCSSLTSITIPNGVTSIGYQAFEGCSSLTSITIPDGVTRIGISAFDGCDKLIQTENGVQYVDRWAINCDNSVTSVNIRSNTVGIADYAFEWCSNLTSITIPDGVTSIGYQAFCMCIGLTSITIPDGVTSIGDAAFLHCRGLTSINFKGTKAQWNSIDKNINWDIGIGNYTVTCTDGTIAKS